MAVNLFFKQFNSEKVFRIVVFVALLFSLLCFTLQKMAFEKHLMILYAIAGLVLIPAIMKRPIVGLYVLPFIVYAIPEINITGMPKLSLGFFVCSITLFAAVAAIAFGHIRPKPSWLWLLVMAMFIIQVIYVVAYNALDTLGFLPAFTQGVTPFLIFSLIVDKESDGRHVLLAWMIAYAAFCFLHMSYAIISHPNYSLVLALHSIRGDQLSGHNPNTLGYIALLYFPLAAVLVGAAKRPLEKLRWMMVLTPILLILVSGFSRSAVFGLAMALGLLILINAKNIKTGLMLLLISTGIFLFILLMWKAIRWDSLLQLSSLKAEIERRLSMISVGLELISLNPWFGIGVGSKVATHSYFTKVAMKYGLIIFPIFCLPFVYIIMVSRKLGRYGQTEQSRSLATGIFIAGTVAIPLAVFSITMKSAVYIQVFWLLMGYLHLANRELVKRKHMESYYVSG